METLEYQRRMRREAIGEAVGFAGHSTRFAQVAPSAAMEQVLLTKPVASAYVMTLQDPVTGLRYFIPGIDSPGDGHPVR